MNRRNFLKFLGVGVASSTLPIVEIKKEKTFREKVTEHVIYPETIVENPLGHEKLDLNDDITGIAGFFTAKMCEDFLMRPENNNMKTLRAMLQFSLTQSSFVGLIIAKQCAKATIDRLSKIEKMVMIDSPEFKAVIRNFGDVMQADCFVEYVNYQSNSNYKGQRDA